MRKGTLVIGDGGGLRLVKRRYYKLTWENSECSPHYLNYSGVLIGAAYMCQNLSNCTFQKCAISYVSYTLVKLRIKKKKK